MNGNVFASSLSASTIVLNANTALSHNSYYAVVCDVGCTAVTLPSLTLSATSTLVNNSRMFLLKNVSASTVTFSAAGGNTFEGGSSTLTLTPNQWAIVHGDNPLARWNVYRPDSPGNAVTDVTYSQLMTFIGSTAATGTTSGYYRITDYATAGYIIGSSGSTYLGATEPLIVNVYFNLAMGSTAQISREAFSPAYPDDVIYYDPFPGNWIYDKSFCLNYDSTAMVANFRGVIFHRHDLKRNIKGGYDWRACIMRRHSFSAGTAAAFGATTNYAIGDVVTNSGVYYVKVSGGPTGFRPNEWVDAPTNTQMFIVSPENNEGLTAPATVSWDLCINDYAHSATGATFRYTATPTTGTDQLTFDTADPIYSKNIDLGRYNFQAGETIIPQPSGGGPTAGSYARMSGTIVNQVRLSNGSLGGEGTAFNRLNNITLGERAWGVHFTSAGFITGNDQRNIHFTDQAQNVTFNPFPSYGSFGATSLNIATGFKNISFRKAVNCYFSGGMGDCEFGAIRDTWVQWCSGLRVGRHQNYEAPLVEYANSIPTPPFSFSIGNVFTYLADVEMGQVRYSLVTGASHSTFRNVEKAHIATGLDFVNFRADLRNTTWINPSGAGGMSYTVFNGRVRNNYFESTWMLNSTFGGDVESNVVNGSYFEMSRFDGGLVSCVIDDMSFHSTSFAGIATSIFGTGTIQSCAFNGPVTNLWPNSTILQLSTFHNVAGVTSINGIANSSVHGSLLDCELSLFGSVVFGGMTGVTGLDLNNATVYPNTLSGIGDMSAAVHPGQQYSKMYVQSDVGNPWGARVVESGSTAGWQFFGATA